MHTKCRRATLGGNKKKEEVGGEINGGRSKRNPLEAFSLASLFPSFPAFSFLLGPHPPWSFSLGCSLTRRALHLGGESVGLCHNTPCSPLLRITPRHSTRTCSLTFISCLFFFPQREARPQEIARGQCGVAEYCVPSHQFLLIAPFRFGHNPSIASSLSRIACTYDIPLIFKLTLNPSVLLYSPAFPYTPPLATHPFHATLVCACVFALWTA